MERNLPIANRKIFDKKREHRSSFRTYEKTSIKKIEGGGGGGGGGVKKDMMPWGAKKKKKVLDIIFSNTNINSMLNKMKKSIIQNYCCPSKTHILW